MIDLQLIDGVQRSKENPDTFFVPDSDEISRLKIGDAVKIGSELIKERFWCIISSIHKDGSFTGEISNNLLCDPSLAKIDDVVHFEPKHILDC